MHETKSSTVPSVNFHSATPILRVRNLKASLDHYVQVLGFEVKWHDEGVMGSVSRGDASLMLCQGAQGNPRTWVWIGVGDAAALHDEYLASGATVRLAPTNYPWAYEMHVEDSDGHVLRFGSEPRSDRPFSPWVEWYREAR